MNSAALCRADESALLLIDAQQRLADAMVPSALAAMTAAGARLLQAAGRLHLPVTVTEQYPKGLGRTLPALREHLPTDHRLLDKTSFSCCDADGFIDHINRLQRRQVVISGMETHICVLQTALQLQANGYAVYVAEDAVCARSPERSRNGIERMRQAGIVITHSDSVLFEWLRDAGHPEFKAISALLREN